jgi:hypothetical protein
MVSGGTSFDTGHMESTAQTDHGLLEGDILSPAPALVVLNLALVSGVARRPAASPFHLRPPSLVLMQIRSSRRMVDSPFQ